jgi:hypothetical protein
MARMFLSRFWISLRILLAWLLHNWVVIMIFLTVWFSFWFFRYSIIPSPTKDVPAAYMLDRITGEVVYLRGDKMYDIKDRR